MTNVDKNSAPLRLTNVALRGVGSYKEYGCLEIKPLTILCGENGSGKSTWFRALNLLKASKGFLPLNFVSDYSFFQEDDAVTILNTEYICTLDDAGVPPAGDASVNEEF